MAAQQRQVIDVDLKKRIPSSHLSLFAGTVAGGVEGFITYPAEFVKTRAQFGGALAVRTSPIAIIRETLGSAGIAGLYSGCGALVAGNALKAGVRFLSYDRIKKSLADDRGKLSAGRTVLAGLGAGCAESLLAVTPSEALKTKLIDDAKREHPRYRGMVDGAISIYRAEGLAGLYRGLVPTTMKQGANSAVRFSSYNAAKGWLQSRHPDSNLNSLETFLCGGIAGLITVYSTMPLDNIKTRMQQLNAKQLYRNSFDCATQILATEGIRVFWRGTTPRLTRLVMSGGIVFAVYEKIVDVLG